MDSDMLREAERIRGMFPDGLVAHLLTEVEQLREIARAVATAPPATQHMAQGDWAVCPFRCGAEDAALLGVQRARLRHSDDCPVTKARALLGQ